jgi:hypothetical protein
VVPFVLGHIRRIIIESRSAHVIALAERNGATGLAAAGSDPTLIQEVGDQNPK